MTAKRSILTLAALLGASFLFAQSPAISPESVDRLLEPYFEIQSALASDNLAAARKGAASLDAALEAGPPPAEVTSLRAAVEKIAAAADISAARSAFQTVSQSLEALIGDVGISGQRDVFKMRCPMAFGGQGGEWLQSSDKLANPYYGAMMLRCGTVEGRLGHAKE